MNPYLPFIEALENAQAIGRSAAPVTSVRTPLESASKALLFSPHPDDECITGLLPLRLTLEAGMQIINVPVTYGSDRARRPERARELQNACDFLGWRNQRSRDDLEPLEAADICKLLEENKPEIIFFPHENDWNLRHIETHRVVTEGLLEMGDNFRCAVAETEYWGAMSDPNLIVEGNATQVAELVAALSLHTGEVARNPYHLLLPAWMQDNVRRGSELVYGQGKAAPKYTFATLYRLRQWNGCGFVSSLTLGTHISVESNGLKEGKLWKS